MKKIPLTQEKFAIVDDCDYTWLKGFKWCYNQGYAVRSSTIGGNQTRIYMHRIILKYQGFEDFENTDHINNNGLDNRRRNLRPATVSQNHHNCSKYKNNTSGFKGVCWHKRAQKWEAKIWINGKRKYLGRFDDPKEAARAYNKAAKKYHKEFAYLNKV